MSKRLHLKANRGQVCDVCRKDVGFECYDCYIAKKRATEAPIQPTIGSWSRHMSVERSVHSADTVQPFKKDGTVNKRFVKMHGTAIYEKESKGRVTREEVLKEAERYG